MTGPQPRRAAAVATLPAQRRGATPDFTARNCRAALRRVAQLGATCASEQSIADAVGWDTVTVRRALGRLP